MAALWRPSSLAETLQLAQALSGFAESGTGPRSMQQRQVASMLQIEEVMPELVNLISEVPLHDMSFRFPAVWEGHGRRS